MAGADCDPLARGGDGPGSSPIASLRRSGDLDIRELDGEAFIAFDSELSIRRAIDRVFAITR